MEKLQSQRERRKRRERTKLDFIFLWVTFLHSRFRHLHYSSCCVSAVPIRLPPCCGKGIFPSARASRALAMSNREQWDVFMYVRVALCFIEKSISHQLEGMAEPHPDLRAAQQGWSCTKPATCPWSLQPWGCLCLDVLPMLAYGAGSGFTYLGQSWWAPDGRHGTSQKSQIIIKKKPHEWFWIM